MSIFDFSMAMTEWNDKKYILHNSLSKFLTTAIMKHGAGSIFLSYYQMVI